MLRIASQSIPGARPLTEIAIDQTPSGEVEVRLDRETVWLRLDQMSELFGRDRTVVGRHVRNVFAKQELDKTGNVQNLHIAGSDRPVGSTAWTGSKERHRPEATAAKVPAFPVRRGDAKRTRPRPEHKLSKDEPACGL